MYLYFFFKQTSTTQIYTLSLHDALPISDRPGGDRPETTGEELRPPHSISISPTATSVRSEEHTSELQSLRQLVCRLLLEKKKTENNTYQHSESHSRNI